MSRSEVEAQAPFLEPAAPMPWLAALQHPHRAARAEGTGVRALQVSKGFQPLSLWDFTSPDPSFQERNLKNSVAPKLLCEHGQGIVSPGVVREGVT